MPFRQQGLSRTLPKNFTFLSADEREPKTPERPAIHLDVPPPPHRHASCLLRRSLVRPETDIFSSAKSALSSSSPSFADIPLPSIEIPSERDAQVIESCATTMPASDDRFLAPARGRRPFRTPPAQIRPMSLDSRDMWDHQTLGSSIRRPSSACSSASDSSASSIEPFSSPRSMGGSCTSPDSDIQDPFFYIEIPRKQALKKQPLLPGKQPTKSQPKSECWTSEMDNHLWNTYQLYLQDPTITPFKMTPGSIPPLGVTHRVARQAKKSWEKRRSKVSRSSESNQGKMISVEFQSRSTTPTPTTNSTKRLWPKSEASTRRRLKLLCKRKFCIAPHYQRMLQSRSPSPFVDLFSRSSRESSMANVTRDLGVSLISSTVPGPLSQLATEGVPSDDWFNNPVQSTPQQGAVLEFASKKDHIDIGDPGSIPRLGSPFIYNTWGPDSSRRRVNEPQTPRPRRGTIHVTGSRLQSPLMDAFPHAGNNSAHQSHLDVDVSAGQRGSTQQHLEELLRQGKLDGVGQQGCVRIRSRGATTSSARSLDHLFSPPPPSSLVKKSASSPLWNLQNETVKRLGSPFRVEGSTGPESLVKFAKHAMSLSEPSADIPAHLVPKPVQSQYQDTLNELPYDHTEEGISDAERMRRQILNMPFTRK